MSAKTLTAIGALVAVVGAGALLAVPTEAPRAQGAAGRYLVTPIEGGIMRVDRDSGEVSVCKERGGRYVCELVPDDREAMAERIDRLERENSRLHRRQGRDYGSRDRRHGWDDRRPPPPVEEYDDLGEGGFATPEEVDRAMNAIDRMMKRFMETARRINRDMKNNDIGSGDAKP